MRTVFLILLLISCSYALKLGTHSLESHNEIIKVATKAEFDNLVESREQIIGYFTAEDWCGPCRVLSKSIKVFSARYPNVLVVSVNIDENPEIADEWKVSGLPATLLIQKNRTVKGSVVGAKPAPVEKLFQTINK